MKRSGAEGVPERVAIWLEVFRIEPKRFSQRRDGLVLLRFELAVGHSRRLCDAHDQGPVRRRGYLAADCEQRAAKALGSVDFAWVTAPSA